MYNSNEQQEAIRFLRDRVLNKGNEESEVLAPDYLHSEGAYYAAGEQAPIPKLPKVKEQESGFWDWLIGQSGEEVKEQKQNFSAYNEAKNEELANPSAPGTYSFGYNNAADYTPDKVGKAIANGDLKEKNQQLYRRYYDPQKNAMLYETIPVAEIGKKGEIKPYKYEPTVLENLGNTANKLAQGDFSTVSPFAKRMQFNQDDFAKKARETINDNLGRGLVEGTNTFLDAFNPVEVINSILDDKSKTRSNIQKYNEANDWETKYGQFGGELGGSVAKMLMGNVAGNAISGARTGMALGGLLPEVGEHTRKAFEDEEYLSEGLRLGTDAAMNAFGMKIASGLGNKAIGALAEKGTKGAIGAIGKNILGQTAMDAGQAAIDMATAQYGNKAIQRQLYGQETTGTEFLKSLGKQVAMSIVFNSVTELPSAARAIARDVGLATKWTKLGQDRIINNIEKVADGITEKMGDKPMTKAEVDRYVASEGAMKVGRSKQGLDILKSFLYNKSGFIDPEVVTNQIIKSIDNGLDDSAILKQLKDDYVAVTPLDVEMAKKNIEGLRSQIAEAPINPEGIKSKLSAYTNQETGKLEFRFEEPSVKAEEITTLEEDANPLDITTAQPKGVVTTINDGTMSTITPETTSSIAGYAQALNRDISLSKTAYVVDKINSLFGITAGDKPDFNNPDGVRRLFETYTKLTGGSPLGKPVKDIVNVVVKHLQGIGTRRNWDNPQLKYEYIDRQVEGDYTNPVVDLIAYGDRKRLYEEIVKSISDGTPAKRADLMAEIFGLKPTGKGKTSVADEFARVTADQRLSVEDIINRLNTYKPEEKLPVQGDGKVADNNTSVSNQSAPQTPVAGNTITMPDGKVLNIGGFGNAKPTEPISQPIENIPVVPEPDVVMPPIEQPAIQAEPVIEQPQVPVQSNVIDNNALGDLGLDVQVPIKPQEQSATPEVIDNIPNEPIVPPEPVMDETPIQQPTPEIDNISAKEKLIRDMQERNKVQEPEALVVKDEPVQVKEEPVVDEPQAKLEEEAPLTNDTDQAMPSEAIKGVEDNPPSSLTEETPIETNTKIEPIEEPKPIEKDPIVEKDNIISEKLENGVTKVTEEPQGTKPAVSWRDQLKDVIVETKAKPMDDTPTRPEIITYPKDDTSAKQAKTKFWEANDGLKELLTDTQVKEINKIFGNSKKVTADHERYVGKIIGENAKVGIDEGLKGEAFIDERLDDISKSIEEAKVDEDTPTIDEAPVETKTASQGIVEKAQSGRMAKDLLNRHSKFKISDEDIKDNFTDLPESETYMLRIVRPDNPEGLTRIEFMPKHGEKPLGKEGLQNIKNNLEAVFPNITKKQKDAFRIDNDGRNLSLIGAEPTKGASKMLTKEDAKILNPNSDAQLSRIESLVDLRDKLKSVPRDIATISIIDNKMKIKLSNDPDAKSNFEQYLIENGIDIAKYHKNIEGTLKKMIDPDQKGLVPEFDIEGIDKAKGSADNMLAQASIFPFAKQILTNPAGLGFITATIGSNLDNEEHQSGLGAAMKWIGTGMVAYYGGKTALKYAGKIMAEPIRDNNGKFVGFTHIVERIKTNPKEFLVSSPLKAKQREHLRSQLQGKDRAEFDKQAKSFEDTETIFSKTSTKMGRSWALVKGERMRKLQIETAAGKIIQDRFYHEVDMMKKEFHKITGNDIPFEAKVVRANDNIYRKTTDISNDMTLTKDEKAALIANSTTDKAIREELLNQGMDNTNIDKAVTAYNQMRNIANTATLHYVKAWLNGYNIDYNKIPQILNELERTAIPTKSEIDVLKETIKENKAKLKQEGLDKDTKKLIKDNLKVNQQAMKAYASQLLMIKNRMKFITYAQDFATQSANMHHVIDRWAYAKKDNPYGLAVYEVAPDNSGRYIRTNDVTSAQKEMEYFKTVEERNTAEQEWLSKYDPKPVDENTKVFKVTIDGKETYVKIENGIDNTIANRWISNDKNIVKQQLMEMLKGEYDIPAIKNGLQKLRNSINDNTRADWDGGMDMEDSAILKETIDAADKALDGITDRANAINTIKDIFKYTLQPKARPFYRNKNVNGYQPKDDKGWVDMWATGLDSQMKSTGNKYVSSHFRNAIENELIDAKLVGFDGEYTKFLASQLDDLNNTKSQSLIPEDMKLYKGVRAVDSVLSRLALAWNAKSAVFNVVQGNLATFMGLVGDGSGLVQSGKAMAKATQGIGKALNDNVKSPYKDEMLDMIHKEIIDSRIPYSTSVEHSKSLNQGRWGKTSDLLMKLQGWTETMNRYQAAMASAITTMEAKPYSDVQGTMTKEQYVKEVLLNSANFTYATQGNFDFMWRSGLEKYALKKTPFGSTMLTLKSPFVNQVLLYSNALKQASSMAKEDKAMAAKMVTALVMIPLFGGVSAIPGVQDLLNAVDLLGADDKRDSINSAINTVREGIGKACETITGSKDVAEFMEDTFSGGILSALTDINMSANASIGEAVIPFIFQKIARTYKDMGNIEKEQNYIEGFAKLVFKQVPGMDRPVSSGRQLSAGYKMDSKGSPLSEGYGVGDAVKESLFGKSFSDIQAQSSIYKGDEELTSQGLHKTLTDLRGYSGIRFAKSEIANQRIKQKITNELRDPEVIRDEIDKSKESLGVTNAVQQSNDKLKTWITDNPLKAARIAGKWLNDETMRYEGVNRDMEKMVRAMKNKVTNYYKAHVMSDVINNLTGKSSNITLDKTIVDYDGRKTKLMNIPFEERGYYYAIGSDKEVKKKEGLYAETDDE